MSEQSVVKNQPENETKLSSADVSIIDILKEMQQVPREYWFNLLKIIKLYRESVTQTVGSKQTQDTERLVEQHRALSELNKQWIEEGDEKEQTETWEYLRQNLDKHRTSI
ncbi:hypothetical protein NIES4071_53850 [Calothrix sp. NIES-4071]|nr:hypothetical protein NIES4071_53850 [Calothrix sp. NIES-4071]BAZ59693.1 hypothetical protein NIES4105_53800 [Calothrix sp. NIES-4105]